MNNKLKSRRLVFTKTKKEWELIDERLKKMGKSKFNDYVNRSIHKLISEYKECPSCIANELKKKIKRQYWMRPGTLSLKYIQIISAKTGIDPSTIVDRIFIVRLFQS